MPTRGSDTRLEVAQLSHPGRKRTNNEDWLGAFQPEDKQRLATKGRLFLVADGMGGHRSGELASRRAVDHVIRTYFDDPDPDVPASLEQAIQAANATLYAAAADSQGSNRWGTTLIAAVIQDSEQAVTRLWIANVGDSRAYLRRGSQLRQLSHDHSLAAAGLGGEGLGRHVITRALGLRPEVTVDIFPFRLQPGDEVLLCSDGLTGPLPDHRIQAILERHGPEEAVRRLAEAANERGGPDNMSMILIRLTGQASSWQDAWRSLLGRFEPRRLGQAHIPRDTIWGLPTWVFLGLALLTSLALLGLGFALGWALF